MPNLRKNSLFLFAFLLVGCVTNHYRVLNDSGEILEISVSLDRALLDCEYLYDYDGGTKDAYGFMIHILDEKNTVFTIAQTNVLNKEACFERYRAVEKILKGSNAVIGGRGSLDDSIPENRIYNFQKKGKFPSNGKSVSFGAAWNDEGQCFDAMMGADDPCPDFPFPWNRYKEVRSDKKTGL